MYPLLMDLEPLHKITERPIRWPNPSGTNAPGNNVPIHALPVLVKNNVQLANKPASLPPHPTIAQTLTALPLSLQFSFNQVTSPTPYGNVISSYRIYRNTSANTFSGAAMMRTFVHDPTHQGPITVQDNTGAGKSYYYFLTSVDTTGQESSPVGASPGAVIVTSQTATPNIGNAVGSTVSPSTTSGTFVTIPEMTLTFTTKGNKVLLEFTGTFTMSAGTPASAAIAIFRDGTQISQVIGFSIASTSTFVPVAATYIDSPSAGSHTFDVRWDTQPGSTLVANGTQRQVQAVELG